MDVLLVKSRDSLSQCGVEVVERVAEDRGPEPPPKNLAMQQQPNFLQTAMQLAPAVAITIAINVIVFVLWKLGGDNGDLRIFMVENFLTSWDGLLTGRVWTLLSSAYSHYDLWHLVINMFVLWNFGVVLERLWGRRTFLQFYLVCSVVGSLAHCMTSAWIIGSPGRDALGASGAVCGLLMAFALHFPKSRILLLGIVPVPALFGVIGLAAFDVWGLINQSRGGGFGIGHGAHLGGALAGGLLWLGYLNKRFTRL
ncbi:MAG: membrane associated rhomboid family serine protease [Planctomycetota bacterium]|jgi:membrane associated rhomboid family serine protease